MIEISLKSNVRQGFSCIFFWSRWGLHEIFGGGGGKIERNRSEPTGRAPGVSASVAALPLLVESVHVVLILRPTGLLQPGHDKVPRGIHIRADVVGDLAGGVAQANTPVERRRTEPDRTAILELVRPPKSSSDGHSIAVNVLVPDTDSYTTDWFFCVVLATTGKLGGSRDG